MKLLLLAIFLVPSLALAAGNYNIKCSYNDSGEIKKMAQFKLSGNYVVSDAETATLDHRSAIFMVGADEVVKSSEVFDNLVFAAETGLKSVPGYKGRKYNNHFKFELDFTGVNNYIEYADLIISKEPVKTEKDDWGAMVQTFDGALNVSYNDHHGDYVWIKCEHRYFER